MFKPFHNIQRHGQRWLVALTCFTFLSACSDDSTESGTSGYLQLYNASTNAPTLYLQVDDSVLAGSPYGDTSSYYEYDSGSYEVEVLWQDSDDSLESINTQTITISGDQTQLLVVTGDINQPDVLTYNYGNETLDDVFSLRFLNLTAQDNSSLDLYMSAGTDSFAEATLQGSFTVQALSDSFHYETDDYKFYITAAGSDVVLFETDAIEFPYHTKYIISIMPNTGPGESPYSLDRLSQSSTVLSFDDINSSGAYRLYNGLVGKTINTYIDTIDDTPEIAALATSGLSESNSLAYGDYSLNITDAADDSVLLKNHLITLNANNDKTIFVYDDTDDGLSTFMLNNNKQISLYDHSVQIINFLPEYASLDLFFVRSSETIDTAEYRSLSNNFATAKNIILPNSTFDIFITVDQGESRLLLLKESVTFNEDSGHLFLTIEEPTTGEYSLTLNKQ